MNKRICRLAGIAMLILAIAFFWVALSNPTLSWPWSNQITYALYLIYLGIMVLLIVAPFGRK